MLFAASIATANAQDSRDSGDERAVARGYGGRGVHAERSDQDGLGVVVNRVIAVDSRGVPVMCGAGALPLDLGGDPGAAGERTIPTGMRAWAAIPSVVRADGIDTFDLEVNANGPVAGVSIEVPTVIILGPGQTEGGPRVLQMLDDGVAPDRIAGDFVFTAGPFRYNTNWNFSMLPAPGRFPEGIGHWGVGVVEFEETDTSLTNFLILPAVGLLRPDIALRPFSVLSADVAVSAHLINVRTDSEAATNLVRSAPGVSIPDLTGAIYSVLGDEFDIINFISTAHVEFVPRLTSGNFTAGFHFPTVVDYTGTGITVQDNSALYGSAGRLIGISALDVIGRGLDSYVLTHELLHQWGVSIGTAFPEVTSGAHWNGRSNAGSLLGGFRWDDDGMGGVTLNCFEGGTGASAASPIDKYLMGLVDGSAVPPLRRYDPAAPFLLCDDTVTSITANVTIAQIQAQFGVRTPGPAGARKNFRLAMVAPSFNRFLTEVEMTWYEIIARGYTAPIAPGAPAPFLRNDEIKSISLFFGEGTTWTTAVQPGDSLAEAATWQLYE